MKIVCFHLYGDNSGSPKVLKMILRGLLQKGYEIELTTSKNGIFYDLSEDMKIHTYPYKFSPNTLLSLFKYIYVQIYTFFYSFKYFFARDTVFFINTILPCGPALAAYLMKKPIVYYYHENAFVKGLFYRILCSLMQKIATQIICVSRYQKHFLKRTTGVVVIPNALPVSFVKSIAPLSAISRFENRNILMLSSLKGYKGALEFLVLSTKLPQYNFCLVLNEDQSNINAFLSERDIACGENLQIYDRQDDVAPFYSKASLVLSLTNRSKFIETFGLTALEAMTANVPVIVPTVGGIAELVEDGVNGYKIDVENITAIKEKIEFIFSDISLYKKLSEQAGLFAAKYDFSSQLNQIETIVNYLVKN